jgi:uncharacterized membrane protein
VVTFYLSGDVVVGQGTSASGNEAFRWTSGGGMTGLGDLPGGSFFSSASNISTDGSVVVGQGSSYSGDEAFRWTSAGGMERLWDVLLAQGVDPAASGWTSLVEARGVSLDGGAIAGYGTRYGNTEGFLAVVPEPASLGLLASAAMLLSRRRTRSRIEES